MADLVTGAPAGQAVPSIRDSINAAAASLGATGDNVSVSSAEPSRTDAPAATETKPERPTLTLDGTGRAHAADGKFTTKPGEDGGDQKPAAETPDPAKATEAQADPSKPTTDPAAKAIDPIDAPVHWPKEWKEAHSKLPPEAQRLLVDQDRKVAAFVTKKVEEARREAGEFADIRDTLAPRIQAWARDGVTAKQALHQLFALSDWAGQDPKGFVTGMAQRLGVNIGHLAQQPAGDGSQPQAPDLTPVLQPVLQEVGTLKQQFETFMRSQQMAQTNTAASAIDNFRNAKDDSGAYKYPHFDAVRETMGLLMQQADQRGVDLPLEEAYIRAVRANPETFAVVQASDQRRKQAETEAQDRARAAAASRTAVSITGQPAGSVAPVPPQGIRELLEWSHARSGGGRV